MSNITEYYDEYCAGTGKKSGGPGKAEGGPTIMPCSKSYDEQPVGGRAQARAQAEAVARSYQRYGRGQSMGPQGHGSQGHGLPAVDADYVATVYSAADQGTHRIRPQWQTSTDPRWSDHMRAGSSTLYEPADRDPCNRSNFNVYRARIDALNTPGKPLAVPDVHKLRYMQNNYMTPDDWY